MIEQLERDRVRLLIDAIPVHVFRTSRLSKDTEASKPPQISDSQEQVDDTRSTLSSDGSIIVYKVFARVPLEA